MAYINKNHVCREYSGTVINQYRTTLTYTPTLEHVESSRSSFIAISSKIMLRRHFRPNHNT